MAKQRKPTPTPSHITLQKPDAIALFADLYNADDWEVVPGERIRGLRRLKSNPNIVIARRQYSKYYSEDKKVYPFGGKNDPSTRWDGKYFKSLANLHKFWPSLPNNMLVWISAHGQTYNTGSNKPSKGGQIGWFTILDPTYKDDPSLTQGRIDAGAQTVFVQIIPGDYAKRGTKASYLVRWKPRV